MDNNGAIIKIEQSQKCVTQQMGVSPWEARMIWRMRQLTGRGDFEVILRKQGDTVILCRVGKPEVVKG